MSATTASTRFIAPFVAGMDASGAANLELVRQETVSIAGIDYEFDVTLDASGAVQLLNSFTVSGRSNEPDAPLNVALSAASDFKAVLADVINGLATSNREASRGGKTATDQLILDLHAGLTAAINNDGLINTVEDIDVTGVDVTIDSSGGADNMATGLTEERCKLLYTQIPWLSRFGKYNDASENQTTSALPLLAGDILTFVFDVNVSNVAPSQTRTDITAAPAAPVSSEGVSGQYASYLQYDLESKRIAFNITMPGTAGEVLVGLKA